VKAKCYSAKLRKAFNVLVLQELNVRRGEVAVSLFSKIIVLAIALVASIIAIVWILMGIWKWAEANPYPTGAIVTVIILSIVAFVWRVFFWKEEG